MLAFESSVNPEGIQTRNNRKVAINVFESSVNPEGIQTSKSDSDAGWQFESSVNPEGIQTLLRRAIRQMGLRVV